MAFNVFDRVQETTTTTGTGTVTLGGVVSGFQSFFNAGLNNGDTTYYCITSGTAWEVGLGTFSTGPNAIARTTILASSASGAAITLAGTSNVFCVYPAGKSVYRDSSGNVTGYLISGGSINSTPIGATTASTGAFTTVVANTSVGIGAIAPTATNFYNAKNITGAVAATANSTNATVQSGVTGFARGYLTTLGTAASTALTSLQHYAAAQGTFSGTSVTYQYGFSSEATLLDAGTNYAFHAGNTCTTLSTAYGFFSAIDAPVSGGTTWGFYSDGTANNLFRGNTYHGNTAVTPTAKIHVAAGSATASTAPLKFTSGTNLTTAEAGAMEYDGENLFFSAKASQRGVVAASQFVILTSDYTTPLGTANVLKQAFNATTNGTLTLTLGSYLFECLLNLSSLSATSGTIAFGFGGTALGRFRYLATANKSATSTTAANTTFSNTAAATIITPATTTTTGYALVQGSIVITTAGTIIPSIALSVAAANVVATGSYFILTPIGSSTVQTVGNWS
jgi:hypothetical protein